VTMAETTAALGDTITIIRARGRRLAKAIHADGTIEAYDAARTVDLGETGIADLAALERLLLRLEPRWDCCIVRGAIADQTRVRAVRRLLHPDPKTGDAPTLRDVPRRWVALDFDDLPRPEGVEATELALCARVAINMLPGGFHQAIGLAQATAQHGISPGSRLRLWYRLSRPTSRPELKHWLRDAPIDTSVFGAGQPIYTATPRFTGGAIDPLPRRIAAVPGTLPEVIVPPAAALASPPREPPAMPKVDALGAGRYGFGALRSGVVRVARATTGTRHQSLLSEARGLARLVATGLLREDPVRTALVGAAGMAGLDNAEAEAVVAWGLAHPATSPLRGPGR
jgi:hypothetical protein